MTPKPGDKRCHGFDQPAHEYSGETCRWSPYFCKECGLKRMNHIDGRLKDIAEHFERTRP